MRVFLFALLLSCCALDMLYCLPGFVTILVTHYLIKMQLIHDRKDRLIGCVIEKCLCLSLMVFERSQKHCFHSLDKLTRALTCQSAQLNYEIHNKYTGVHPMKTNRLLNSKKKASLNSSLCIYYIDVLVLKLFTYLSK